MQRHSPADLSMATGFPDRAGTWDTSNDLTTWNRQGRAPTTLVPGSRRVLLIFVALFFLLIGVADRGADAASQLIRQPAGGGLCR
jgi:hypothetical protein